MPAASLGQKKSRPQPKSSKALMHACTDPEFHTAGLFPGALLMLGGTARKSDFACFDSTKQGSRTMASARGDLPHRRSRRPLSPAVYRPPSHRGQPSFLSRRFVRLTRARLLFSSAQGPGQAVRGLGSGAPLVGPLLGASRSGLPFLARFQAKMAPNFPSLEGLVIDAALGCSYIPCDPKRDAR